MSELDPGLTGHENQEEHAIVPLADAQPPARETDGRPPRHPVVAHFTKQYEAQLRFRLKVMSEAANSEAGMQKIREEAVPALTASEVAFTAAVQQLSGALEALKEMGFEFHPDDASSEPKDAHSVRVSVTDLPESDIRQLRLLLTNPDGSARHMFGMYLGERISALLNEAHGQQQAVLGPGLRNFLGELPEPYSNFTLRGLAELLSTRLEMPRKSLPNVTDGEQVVAAQEVKPKRGEAKEAATPTQAVAAGAEESKATPQEVARAAKVSSKDVGPTDTSGNTIFEDRSNPAGVKKARVLEAAGGITLKGKIADLYAHAPRSAAGAVTSEVLQNLIWGEVSTSNYVGLLALMKRLNARGGGGNFEMISVLSKKRGEPTKYYLQITAGLAK